MISPVKISQKHFHQLLLLEKLMEVFRANGVSDFERPPLLKMHDDRGN